MAVVIRPDFTTLQTQSTCHTSRCCPGLSINGVDVLLNQEVVPPSFSSKEYSKGCHKFGDDSQELRPSRARSPLLWGQRLGVLAELGNYAFPFQLSEFLTTSA